MRLLAAMLLVVLHGAAHASAQPAANPSDTARDEARGVLVEAVAAFDAGNYERALELFERARALAPRVEIEFNVAMCLERLDRLEDARAAYERALASGELDTEAAARASVRIEDVERRIAERDAAPPTPPEPAPAAVPAPAAAIARTRSEPDEPSRRLVGPLFYAGLAVAVVGGAGIVGFGLRTEALADEFRQGPTGALADEGELMRTLTNVSIGVAVLGAVLCLVDLLFVD